MFIRYYINDTDRFEESLYPVVVSEITGLHKSLLKIRSYQKIRIVISLLRDHSIKTVWLAGNKELASLLTSGSLATSHLESLFEASKGNQKFLDDLETYITTKLS